MANLYLATAEPSPATPPLAGDVRADVVIVGGGFTGLSTALHLAERGARVVLLEAEAPGWGASGRNGGQVNPGLKHDPDLVERDFGAELGGRMVAFAGAAPAFVFALIERLRIPCELRQCGTLRAAAHPKHLAKVRSTAEQYARRGAPVVMLDRDAAAGATGTDRYAGALLDRRGGALNPLSFARGLARAAMQAGAAIHGGTRALGLQRQGQEWRVQTATGTVTAAQVVLATNGYTDGLWPELDRSLVPLFGAIAATEPLPEALAQAVMPAGHVLFEVGTVTVYYRLDVARRLLIGGRGPMREVGTPTEIAHILKYAVRLWPALQAARWTHAWGGRLGFTADQYPHVHEPAEGVLVCLGYSGRGVALASALGCALAARIVDREREFPMPITAIKPIALQRCWPITVPAAILLARIKDAFGL
ncbi:MAG: FAD-binding oxidoreductase [Steroidobacteraceae bacterium]